MPYTTPFIGAIQKVEDDWVDYNGHLNMAYYNVMFDRATDEILGLVGLGIGYAKATGNSFFTLESHVTYMRELHGRDAVLIKTQFLDYDAKRVHYVQQMFHECEGWLACVNEGIVMHVDLSTKKSSPLPTDVLEKIKEMHVAQQDLPVPAQVGHRIGIPRKRASELRET